MSRKGLFAFFLIFLSDFSTFAGMKARLFIALLAFAFTVACTSKVKAPESAVPELVEGPSAELGAIDSLMWRQPDSALTVMLEFAGSAEVDSLDEFNGHYCQVLISELLYKNDWKQSNREELLKAVGYFDSIVGLDGVDVQKQNAFLTARAHYINGVGFYEKGDVVNACAEYLKTLEVMEAHFEENELAGHKARFLAYTYNRLGDLFSEQFMMESAITCYENALVYCKISPTSPIGIPNILYRIGKQYDKKNEIENASLYYGQALENMAATENIVYRNIVASKALCDYKSGVATDSSLEELYYTLKCSDTEKERLNRYLTIGGIHFLERNYDSAIFYLEPVFEDNDAGLQTQAAGYLRIVYDSIGDVEKSNVYMRFLTNQKKPDGENKALVSKLEDLYKNYSNQKLEKQAETEREIAKKKVLDTVVPIGIAVALAIFCVLIWRNRRQLKYQQEEADKALGEAEQEHEKELRLWQAEADKTLEETKKKYEEELRQLKADTEQQLEEVERKHQQWIAKAKERHEEELREQRDQSKKEIEKTKKRHEEELEAERLVYQKEQEALRQNLRQREEQVNALETAMVQQREEASRRREAFLKEPICQHINELLHGRHITTRDTSFKHEAIALKEEDYKQLKEAVERHYAGFDNALLSRCPSLRHSDLALCHLHLMGLGEGEIAALRSRTYSGIKKQNESLQEKLGVKEDIASYILRVIEGLCGTQNGTQGGTQTNGAIDDDLDAWIERQIKDHPKITTEELAEKSHKGVRTIKRHISMMRHIRYVGSGYSGHWEVIE